MACPVVHLPASRLEEAADALAAAFMDDPLQSYTFPDADERRRLSTTHFGALLRYGLMAGQVLTSAEPGGGAAVWMPPEAAPTDEMFVESGLSRLDELLGAEAARRFGSVIDFAEPFHKAAMPSRTGTSWSSASRPLFKDRGSGARCCSRCSTARTRTACPAISRPRSQRT